MLTDSQVRAFKAGAKTFKKADGRGLYLFVHNDGRKVWR